MGNPESLVMHGGENQVLHVAADREFGDLVRVEAVGAKPVGDRAQFLARKLLAVHDPFAAGQDRIETEMNNEPIAGVFKPFVHFFFLLGRASILGHGSASSGREARARPTTLA